MEKSKMFPVSIEELLAKPKILVDLYVQLSEAKFVIVAKAGTNMVREQLEKFKSKGATHLYVKSEDYITLVRHTINVAGMTVNSSSVDNLGKLVAMEDAVGSVFRQARDLGFNEGVVLHSKLVAEAALTLIASDPALSAIVERFQRLKNEDARHSMLVSFVAVMLGRGMEWVKPATLEKLALGGLIHDIGKLKLPADILHKDPDRMNHDEKVIYRSHPELGRQMLSGVRLPDDVLLIVYEHHELADGSGFPRGQKDFITSPLARVVALANGFADAVLANGKTLNANSARKAMEQLEVQRGHHFNRDALRALRRLIESEVGKKVG